MAFTHLLSPPLNLSPTKFPKLPFKHSQILHLTRRRFSIKASILSSDRQQEILEAVAESNEKLLPVVRTYENDSARLSLIGAVDFQQALTAAAADGGVAAEEHLEAGIPAMVIETVFPGPPDENSTVSTRLFLPARKVKEKAKTIKRSVGGDVFANATSQNILAMTFRQVVLHQLWSFELVMFSPGATRDMDNLEDPREEVPASGAISSSDEMVISSLAEVICLSALENTDMQLHRPSFGRGLTKLFPWFRKPTKIVSKDLSVILEKVLENEIVANSKALLEKFVQEREKFRSTKGKSRDNWWTLSSFSELEMIGGPEFVAWIREFVPVYRLQVDGSKLETVKFEGGNLLTENYWEIFLTHSEMVSLANVLDMYYEDSFTLPGKRLTCGVTVKLSNLQKNKGNSPLRIFSYVLASGLFLLAISMFSKFQMPRLPSWRQHPQKTSLQTSIRCVPLKALESDKLDALCISIITRIKEYFHWPEEVKTEKGCFAWTGDLPLYLRRMAEIDSGFSDVSSAPTLAEERLAGMKESAQDIASYNVILSTDGRLVGFQPTTQVAVNHWSSNPLAKELHGGRKLSPGFIEPRVKMIRPDEVVVFELLMSVNPESPFALVRPLKNAEMDVQ